MGFWRRSRWSSGATVLEWALFPLSFEWAAVSDPAGYEREFGEGASRPTYLQWATYDVLGVGISAAFVQGLRVILRAQPQGSDGADDLDLLGLVEVEQVDLAQGVEVVA